MKGTANISAKTTKRTAMLATVVVLAVAAIVVPTATSLAQGWWPWSSQEPRPVPREPVYRPPAGQPPASAPLPGGPGAAGPQARSSQQSGICLQLEQRLAQEAQRGQGGRDVLPKIDNDLRNAQRNLRAAQSQIERFECYEQFLFTKTLRRTRQCLDLSRQVEDAERQVGELTAQRQQILGVGDRSFQDDIIRELARNGCGATYQQEASRRGGTNPFSSLWQDEDSEARGAPNSFGNMPFATYRTLCVRLCDGYYFPVSFSTLPNHFSRDADACQSKCAAPVELYYHQNPGGAVEQMLSSKTQQPYTSLKSAFRYRKEFVQGCSCKQAEYVPSAGETGRRAEQPEAQTTKQALRK